MSCAMKVEFPGFDQAMLIGTSCFHRRESLFGRTFSEDYKKKCNNWNEIKSDEDACVLEERAKSLACCNCEENTEWGKGVSSPDLSLTLLLHASIRTHAHALCIS